MEITHGIAMLFIVVFMVIATLLKKAMWWLLCIGYMFAAAYMAIINEWELMFFPVLVICGIIAIIAFMFLAIKGELI